MKLELELTNSGDVIENAIEDHDVFACAQKSTHCHRHCAKEHFGTETDRVRS